MEKMNSSLDRQAGFKQWSAMCAKVGEPTAAIYSPAGSSLSEMHSQRKTLRRAVAKYVDRNDSEQLTEGESLGLEFAGDMIARLNSLMETHGTHSAQSGSIGILRSAAQVAEHFSRKSDRNEGMTIAALLRGVGGLRSTDAVRAALSEGTASEGGYAVPDIVQGPILAALMETSALTRAGVGIKPLATGAKSLTYPAIDTIPTAAWRLENGAVAESDVTFRAVTTVPHSLAFLVKCSRELLADADGLDSALTTAFAQAMSQAMDNAGLLGSGTAPSPRGLVNVAGVQTVSLGTDGALLADYSPFLSASGKLLEQSVTPSAAILSIRDRMTLAGLKDTTGQPLNVPPYLSGMNFVPSAELPTDIVIGASGAKCAQAIVGDFSTVHWVMREQLTVMRAAELYAATGQIAFVVHVRADLAVTYPKSLVVISGIKGA